MQGRFKTVCAAVKLLLYMIFPPDLVTVSQKLFSSTEGNNPSHFKWVPYVCNCIIHTLMVTVHSDGVIMVALQPTLKTNSVAFMYANFKIIHFSFKSFFFCLLFIFLINSSIVEDEKNCCPFFLFPAAKWWPPWRITRMLLVISLPNIPGKESKSLWDTIFSSYMI